MQIRRCDARAGALVELPQPAPAGLILASVGRTSGMVVPPGHASLWLVLRGKVQVHARRGQVELVAGEWLQLEGEDAPMLRAGAHAVAIGVVMGSVAQARLANVTQLPLLPGMGQATPTQSRTVLQYWQLLRNRRADTGWRQANGERALAPLLQALGGLQQHHEAMVTRCPGRSLRRRRLLFCRLQKAWLYQRLNLHRAVPVTQLAEMSCMSLWYFIRTYNGVYGQCPQAMATSLRLEQAARLLRDTALSIAEVGEAVGFENNCSFSRAFRQRFGRAPSLYRVHGDCHHAIAAHNRVNARQAG